jgi:hypothetical protein
MVLLSCAPHRASLAERLSEAEWLATDEVSASVEDARCGAALVRGKTTCVLRVWTKHDDCRDGCIVGLPDRPAPDLLACTERFVGCGGVLSCDCLPPTVAADNHPK